MDIGSIFLILGLLVLVALFISRPFLERKATSTSGEDHELSSLLAERDRILNALQELDFDFALGKIPEADFPGQRAALLQRGADILRQLDTLRAVHPHEDAASREAREAREASLEAAIAARRFDAGRLRTALNGAAGRLVHAPDDDLEAVIAVRRRERKEKAGGFCPQCGRPVQKSDRFCPKCGATLSLSVSHDA